LIAEDPHFISVDSDERIHNNETPLKAVTRIAKEKMELARTRIKEGIIITADTIVTFDGKILGKPADSEDAVRMLKSLGGRTHTVYTGFAVYSNNQNKHVVGYERTKVSFRDISEAEITRYVATGSPLDKAGAYGIQDDYGAVFVKKISGCYYNVVGLPLTKIYLAISEAAGL